MLHTSSTAGKSALLLLVPWVSADHANNTITTNDLAIAANFLYRRLNSHVFPFKRTSALSLGTEHDAGTGEVIRCQFDSYLIAWQNSNIVHSHLARNVTKHHMSVFELDSESCIRQRFQNLTLHLDRIFFSHAYLA